MSLDESVRFWLRTELQPNGCIEWARAISGGYGRVPYKNGLAGAHRLALVTALGRDLTPGMHVDHLCRNPTCVNPEHLEEVTPLVNMKRGEATGAHMLRALETDGFCLRGHPVAQSVVTKPGRGSICTECEKERDRIRFANRSAADRERRRLRAAKERAARRMALINSAEGKDPANA